MVDIVHYFNKRGEEELIDIFIDKELFATIFPKDFNNFNQLHPLILNAFHHNIFS